MTDGCDREQRNSSDNNCLYDMAGFNSLLLLSFTSDEYFKLSADRSMLVRQDFGAYITLQVIDLIHTEPDVLQEQFLSFADESKYSPSTRSIFRYFIFSVDDYSKYTDSFSPVFKNITEKCMKNGVVADFIIADLRNGTVETTDGKRVGDKKIRNVIEKAIKSYTQSQEHGKSAESIIKEKRNETVKKYSELGERKRIGVSSPVMFLILINIMIFFAGLITEQNSGIDIFKSAGIQDNELIRDGEWWRLFTSMFLHSDITHLAGNMFFLFYLGTIVYRYYSTAEFFAVYFLSGLLGNLLSFWFTDYRSLGASGAIMGLGGLIIYRMFFGKNAKVFRKSGNYFMFALMIIFNLFYGLFAVEENIDNYGHFGGFIGGFLLGIAITNIRKYVKKNKNV